MTDLSGHSELPLPGPAGDAASLTKAYGRPSGSRVVSAASVKPTLSREQQLEIRAELGGARRNADTLKINVHHQRARLERIAGRIPDFASYRKIVIDDLRDAWYHDRMHNERTVSNQVEQWKRLFPYWAARVGERLAVKIHSLGHSGAYECQLVDRTLPDVWETFFDAGVAAGASWAVLNEVYRQFKDAPAKTVRASGRINRASDRSK